jgi:uncharacterized membrane protein (DUF2068 family)
VLPVVRVEVPGEGCFDAAAKRLASRPGEPSEMTAASQKQPMSGGFVAIILFKYFKAVVFGIFGITALRLSHLAGLPSVDELARFFRVAPEREIIQEIASIVSQLTPGQAIGIGVTSIFVSLVFATEGTLLAFRVWWSTYFTIVITACGIPLEIYEIIQRPVSVRRYLLLVVNVAILVYLWKRRNEFRAEFTEERLAGNRDANQASTSSG